MERRVASHFDQPKVAQSAPGEGPHFHQTSEDIAHNTQIAQEVNRHLNKPEDLLKKESERRTRMIRDDDPAIRAGRRRKPFASGPPPLAVEYI